MTDKLITNVVLVLTAIIGVAIVAVLVSNKSNSPTIIKSVGSGFACAISEALSPISGSAGECQQGFATSTISFGGIAGL